MADHDLGHKPTKWPIISASILNLGSHQALRHPCLQGLLLLFVKVLIMMTVAIVLGGDPRNTTYIWTYFKDVSSFQSLLNREVMLALLVQSFQQSIVTEPIGRMIEGLLFCE